MEDEYIKKYQKYINKEKNIEISENIPKQIYDFYNYDEILDFDDPEDNKENILKKMIKYEKLLPKMKDIWEIIISQNPMIESFYKISLFMNLEEIKKYVFNLINNFRKNNQLFTNDEFSSFDINLFHKYGVDLTRIWGAEYLKKEFEKNNDKTYDVPNYYITVPSLKNIEVRLSIEEYGIIIAGINFSENTFLYRDVIKGRGVGEPTPELEKYKYADLGSTENRMQNVIENINNGKKYVINTEMKSFYMSFGKLAILNRMFAYYSDRFLYVNKDKIRRNEIFINVNLEDNIVTNVS